MRRFSAVILVIAAAASVGMLGFKFSGPQDTIKKDDILPLIRLHIIANSDEKSDQEVKLLVRDAIIKYLDPKFDNLKDLSEARRIVDAEQDNFIEIAKRVLAANNKDYDVQARRGIYQFPPRNYGAFFLPAGEYEALRIVLGNGGGKNWWCVLFPPLCLIQETGYNPAQVPVVITQQPTVTSQTATGWNYRIGVSGAEGQTLIFTQQLDNEEFKSISATAVGSGLYEIAVTGKNPALYTFTVKVSDGTHEVTSDKVTVTLVPEEQTTNGYIYSLPERNLKDSGVVRGSSSNEDRAPRIVVKSKIWEILKAWL